MAVDLGATSVKVHLARFSEGVLEMSEVGRFRTHGTILPSKERDELRWNLPSFLERIRELVSSVEVDSISFDSWGVDFALFDSKGRLLSLPYHYRDSRTEGVMERALEVVDPWRLYSSTGIQFMPINTIYQLYSMVLDGDPLLKVADEFLMIADVFNYWFSGEMIAEYTLASTTQLLNVKTGSWNLDIASSLGIPSHLFPKVVKPATVIGDGSPKVVAGASHDTASAVVAVPFESKGVYVSLGTWALVGVELDEPIVNEESFEKNFTNEGGVEGRIRFLKNTTGMWILEECNRDWKRDYSELVRLAGESEIESFIDPDDPSFSKPGGMCERVMNYLERTNQRSPEGLGDMARVIYESIAHNLASVIEDIEGITREEYEVVHVVGGGSRNEFMNTLIANITGKEVRAGPHEATAVGNALVQLMALGELNSLEEVREVVRRSFEIKRYKPSNESFWSERHEMWKEVTGK